MSEGLKKGWRIWRFDQMATMVNDRVDDPAEANVEYYVGLEHLDPESLTIRRWGSPSDVNATKLLFRKGDIIFGRRRVYQRKLAVAHFDGICSAHALVLRAKPEVVVPEFLPFFMQSDLFMERAKQISVGSLSPTINWKTLAKEEFALPPMEEQKKIAFKNNALLDLKSKLNEALCLAVKIRTCICLEIGKKASANITSDKKSQIKTISEMFDCLDNRRIPLNESERAKIQGPIPYYGATGKVDSISDYMFDETLILVAEDGGPFQEFDKKPNAYLIEGKSWINNHVHVLRPKDINSTNWLFMNLVHRDLRKFTSGTTRGKLNKSQLMKIPIWMPDQKKVDEMVNSFLCLNKVIASIKERINLCGEFDYYNENLEV